MCLHLHKFSSNNYPSSSPEVGLRIIKLGMMVDCYVASLSHDYRHNKAIVSWLGKPNKLQPASGMLSLKDRVYVHPWRTRCCHKGKG
ncbi:hypothetical protein P8452_03938 [Trifolium repens]|nr:hypothetical protein P8452_03938 [Trifolium repens]